MDCEARAAVASKGVVTYIVNPCEFYITTFTTKVNIKLN